MLSCNYDNVITDYNIIKNPWERNTTSECKRDPRTPNEPINGAQITEAIKVYNKTAAKRQLTQ